MLTSIQNRTTLVMHLPVMESPCSWQSCHSFLGEGFLVLVVKNLSNLTRLKVVSPYVEHKITGDAKLRFKDGTLLD